MERLLLSLEMRQIKIERADKTKISRRKPIQYSTGYLLFNRKFLLNNKYPRDARLAAGEFALRHRSHAKCVRAHTFLYNRKFLREITQLLICGRYVDVTYAVRKDRAPRLTAIIIIPATSTPASTEIVPFLMFIPRRLAARLPVQAPVPGKGMPTNRVIAR